MFSGSAHYNYDNTQINENENSVQASSGWSNSRSASASKSHTINTNFCDSNEQCRTGSSTTGGTSDARFIKKIAPCLEFGLVNKTMHKIDECVSLKDLKNLTKIYQNILEEYFR